MIDAAAQSAPTRRAVVAGLAGIGALAATRTDAGRDRRDAGRVDPDRGLPDLGPNVLVIDPAMPRTAVQARLDAIFRAQERAHVTDARQAVLFMPGAYDPDVNVGFFTQVAGLGTLPGDVASRRPGVRFASVTTISLGGGKGMIAHLVNDTGAAARPGAIRQTLAHYP